MTVDDALREASLQSEQKQTHICDRRGDPLTTTLFFILLFFLLCLIKLDKGYIRSNITVLVKTKVKSREFGCNVYS